MKIAAAFHAEAVAAADALQTKASMGDIAPSQDNTSLRQPSEAAPALRADSHTSDPVGFNVDDHGTTVIPLPKNALLPDDKYKWNAERAAYVPRHQLSDEEWRAKNAQRMVDEGYAALAFDDKMQRSYPDNKACSQAAVRRVPSDGACFFHCIIDISRMTTTLQLSASTTSFSLRASTVQFLRDNRNKKVLLPLAFPDEGMFYITPEDHLRTIMDYRSVHKNGKEERCDCNLSEIGRHVCDGRQYGTIKLIGGFENLARFFNFDEYLTIMARPDSFAEEMEIMAVAAMLNTKIAVWIPSSDHAAHRNDASGLGMVNCYHRMEARNTIVLLNGQGRNHYDWLFFGVPSLPDAVVFNAAHQGGGVLPANRSPVAATPALPLIAAEKAAEFTQAPTRQKIRTPPKESATRSQTSKTQLSLSNRFAILAQLNPNSNAIKGCIRMRDFLYLQLKARHQCSSPFKDALPLFLCFPPFSEHAKIESSLYKPCRSNEPHTQCCNSHGDCECCPDRNGRCGWDSDAAESWANTTHLPAFVRVAPTLLTVASELVLSQTDELFKNYHKILYFLYRVAYIADKLHEAMKQIVSPEQHDIAMSIREALKQMADSIALVAPITAGMTMLQENCILMKIDVIRNGLINLQQTCDLFIQAQYCSSDLSQNSACAGNDNPATPPAPSESPSASSVASSDILIPLSYGPQYFSECKSVVALSASYFSLARRRLTTITKDNQTIAVAQLKGLVSKLQQLIDQMRVYKGHFHHKRSAALSESMDICIKETEIQCSLISRLASEVHSMKSFFQPPALSSPGNKRPSTPKNKNALPRMDAQETLFKQQLTQLLLRVDVLTKSIRCTPPPAEGEAIVLQNSSTVPPSTVSAPNAKRKTGKRSDHEEQQIIEDEAEDDANEELHAEHLNEKRVEAGSTASIFQAESRNIQTLGGADSFDSQISLSTHSSDAEFLSNSQQKETAKLHPRHLDVKEALNDATGDEVVSYHKAKTRFTAWCSNGHLLNHETTLKKKAQVDCTFCHKAFIGNGTKMVGLFTCHCHAYACMECLSTSRTYPRPPKCPELACDKTCTLKKIPISKACRLCRAAIKPETKAWSCPTCRPASFICPKCRSDDIITARSTTHPLPLVSRLSTPRR